ncbi:MAG: RagB/SusD family nutrient uptake outer membrane protein [Bacteroidales bacterium]|nr:RagB/SusD family nutrient uptake outer membrane protein [Bacteroidales bacterium]
MKNKLLKFVYLLVVGFGLVTYSCADLNVENLNDPDTDDVLATPTDLIKLAGGAYRIWSQGINEYDGPGLAMATMADQLTCSWGNAAMKDLSSEPRQGFNNDITYSYAPVNRVFWNNMYSALSQVNDVLKKIDGDGTKVVENGQDMTMMLQSWCYFIQGLTHGYLGLVFDQANIIDWDTDLATLEFQPYSDVVAAGVAFLDKALTTIDAAPDFTLPNGFISGYNLTKAELRQLVSSFEARILVSAPRNATENDAVDWSKVLSLAQNGIDWDFEPYMDDISWYDLIKTYGVYPGWARIDHRIINLMDHDYPSRWPDDNVWPNGDPGEANSDDARLTSDFEFLSSQDFKPDRGYYHFSHYRYQRYDYYLSEWTTTVPYFLAWENDLMIAEALVRANNDVAGATAILNDPNGARKARGGLADVAPSSVDEALDLIFYERDVELILTTSGDGFFDMRRRDMLQRGTILHFPVPAAELEILGLDNYTIAGPPDGENISNGHWVGYDGLVSPIDWNGK